MKKSDIITAVVIIIIILVGTFGIAGTFRYLNNATEEEKTWCCEECKALHDELSEKFDVVIPNN